MEYKYTLQAAKGPHSCPTAGTGGRQLSQAAHLRDATDSITLTLQLAGRFVFPKGALEVSGYLKAALNLLSSAMSHGRAAMSSFLTVGFD